MKETLNLPRTDFPMKANLPKREPEIQKFWESINLFKKLAYDRDGESFILHDGPPYANGHIHLGHSENKILKDVFNKYKALKGYRIPFIPGWDTHGQPIENEIIKRDEEVSKWINDPEKFKDINIKLKIREKCRIFANEWLSIQREEFKRLGILADWHKPYITMNNNYESIELEILAHLVEEGYIYRQRMPIHWCYHCRTALSLAEIEYKEKEDPSLYFLVKQKDEDLYILVWTTTPWTLISNRAFAFSKDTNYVIVKHRNLNIALAKDCINILDGEYEIIEEVKGTYFEGKKFIHPLFEDLESFAVFGDFVSVEEGTGIVHIAPGHGKEDYEVSKIYNLEVFSPVDDFGKFTEEADNQTKHPLNVNGLIYYEGGNKAIERLKEKNLLYKLETTIHNYPFCWRCKNPLIFRATSQWFLDLSHKNLKERALNYIKNVNWYPKESINRIYNSVKERPDWVISRQRVWGVFIPSIRCLKCNNSILDSKIIKNVAKLTKEESSDVWLIKPLEIFLTENYKCPHCLNTSFEKEYDILDVWFDSGATGLIVLQTSEYLRFPADMYLEGSDQHRGWFNASLILSVAVKDEPPYKVVITHGWTLDEKGRAMHKSLGNVISPLEVVDKYGADVLRLWVNSNDWSEDIRLGNEILSRIIDAYRKIRNTYRYMLSNLYDFSKDEIISYEDLLIIDKYILHRYAKVIEEIEKYYESFETHKVFRTYYEFINDELSAFYLDIVKDRLYTYKANSLERKSAQSVIYIMLKGLLVAFSPILSHTCEEAYQHLPFKDFESVFLESFPKIKTTWINEKIEKDFEKLLKLRESAFIVLEKARQNSLIGSNLDALLYIDTEEEFYKAYEKELKEILGISQLRFSKGGDIYNELNGFRIGVSHALGRKCQRCWMWFEDLEDEICKKCKNAIS
ncbi:MAG: isoleucine--tRNA ligase [candidate division WOR-3 bacterium]|nr:isoleucine--tRNA ligase [candidate division WOR-3 bacterium]MCX7947210.1 isoleucine--tRNA ligase [candidate division WOR-3 bacterium]MDW8150266.1 isoleucine--tRNA ligase [candidate division WOR-3 bacterium]